VIVTPQATLETDNARAAWGAAEKLGPLYIGMIGSPAQDQRHLRMELEKEGIGGGKRMARVYAR